MTTQTNQSKDGSRVLTSTLIGQVTGDKRDKTCTVEVSYQAKHAKYGKYIARASRYHVHDPENAGKVGDRVEITNIRPVSKTKSWRLVKVITQSNVTAEHKTEA